MWLKSCPRCRGDLYENRDIYGRYVDCLQCGHHMTEVEEVVLRYAARHPVQQGAGQAGAERVLVRS